MVATSCREYYYSQLLTVLQSRHNSMWIGSPLHCPCAERLLADGERVGGAEGVNGVGGGGNTVSVIIDR